MKYYILIYIVGCLISYMMIRWVTNDQERTWRVFWNRVMAFFCSWPLVFILLFGAFVLYLKDMFKHSKPPKWF